MYKTILVTQPEYDYTTRYVSTWAEKAIQHAKKKKNNVIVLKNKRADKNIFISVVKKTNPSFIFLNGHGNSDTIHGQDDKPLIDSNDNLDFLKKTIIYALSCQSAKNLGRYCIEKGVTTYIGYNEDFIFIIDRKKRTNPKEDNIAALFLNASNAIPFSLLKGKTTKESHYNSQKAFRKTIRTLLTSESKSYQTSTIRFLIWDMQHQVCLGNQQAFI